MEKTKKCNKCQLDKSLSEFSKHGSTKGGFSNTCKVCVNKKHKERRAKRKELGLCRDCGKLLDRKGLLCKSCNDKATASRVNKARTFRKAGLCGKCGKKSEKYLCAECSDKERANRVRLITEIYEHYGEAKCACCGESMWEFLTVDHIEGDGTKHRESLGIKAGYDFARWLKNNNFPEGYQVLCMNCNFSIGRFGYCPHQTESREDIKDVSKSRA